MEPARANLIYSPLVIQIEKSLRPCRTGSKVIAYDKLVIVKASIFLTFILTNMPE